jgi:hypothetical protein
MDQATLLAQLTGSGGGEWVKVSEEGDEIKVILTFVRVEQEQDYQTRSNKFMVKRKATDLDKALAEEKGYKLKVDDDGYLWKPMTENKITDEMRQDENGALIPIWQVRIHGTNAEGKALKYTISGQAKMESWAKALAEAGVSEMKPGGKFKQTCTAKVGTKRTYVTKYVAPDPQA